MRIKSEEVLALYPDGNERIELVAPDQVYLYYYETGMFPDLSFLAPHDPGFGPLISGVRTLEDTGKRDPAGRRIFATKDTKKK